MEFVRRGDKKSTSFPQFKSKLLTIIRPKKRSLYNISDIEGVGYLTKVHVRFSSLNERKFRHNFDSLTPLCACGIENWNNEQFHLIRFLMVLV